MSWVLSVDGYFGHKKPHIHSSYPTKEEALSYQRYYESMGHKTRLEKTARRINKALLHLPIGSFTGTDKEFELLEQLSGEKLEHI